MNRERALKVMMVLIRLFFSAAIYQVTVILWHRDQPLSERPMGLSLYVTLGILLLIAVRNPSAHRSVIAFAAWSSFAQAAVMTVMVFRDARSRDEWPAPAILIAIGLAMMVLAPAKQLGERASAAGA